MLWCHVLLVQKAAALALHHWWKGNGCSELRKESMSFAIVSQKKCLRITISVADFPRCPPVLVWAMMQIRNCRSSALFGIHTASSLHYSPDLSFKFFGHSELYCCCTCCTPDLVGQSKSASSLEHSTGTETIRRTTAGADQRPKRSAHTLSLPLMW